MQSQVKTCGYDCGRRPHATIGFANVQVGGEGGLKVVGADFPFLFKTLRRELDLGKSGQHKLEICYRRDA